MIKWFVYIVLVLLALPRLSSAQNFSNPVADHSKHPYTTVQQRSAATDTVQKAKQQTANDSKKIKEVAKSKRQSKPEKIDDQPAQQPNNNTPNPPPAKPKRERRPAGLERPPEIPRRNGN